ncbi:MAG: hypothetical protein H6729_05965 [Deltaproteobacteria bacterium]|nr:hypothetical protein [Deltaproteobacteria bacterium]
MADAKTEHPRPRRPAIGAAIEPIEISEATLVVPPKIASDQEAPGHDAGDQKALGHEAADFASSDREATEREATLPVVASEVRAAPLPRHGSQGLQGPGVVGRPPMDELSEKMDVVFEVPRFSSNRLRVALIAALAVLGLYLFVASREDAAPEADGASIERPSGSNAVEASAAETSAVEPVGDVTGLREDVAAPKKDEVGAPQKDEVRMTFHLVPSHTRMVVNGKPHRGDLVVPRGPDEYVVIFSAKGYEEQVFRLTGERSVSIDVALTKVSSKRRVRRRGR